MIERSRGRVDDFTIGFGRYNFPKLCGGSNPPPIPCHMLTHTMPSKVPSLVPPIRVNRSSIWQWSNCCNDRFAPCITVSFHPRMRDRQWKAIMPYHTINNYPKLPRPGKGNMQLTLAKVRQNLSSAPSLSANDVQDHEGRSPWKNPGNRHPELVHTRFSQRYSGGGGESGHFNGKQIDTPPCMFAKFCRTFHTAQHHPF